jgi:hypothetical protein
MAVSAKMSCKAPAKEYKARIAAIFVLLWNKSGQPRLECEYEIPLYRPVVLLLAHFVNAARGAPDAPGRRQRASADN